MVISILYQFNLTYRWVISITIRIVHLVIDENGATQTYVNVKRRLVVNYIIFMYCILIYFIFLDSIPLLAPSSIDYSKVDHKWIHWVIRHGPISCKKQGITYIKSYFIIDLGSFKCYLDTFITNLHLFYIRMWVTRLTW